MTPAVRLKDVAFWYRTAGGERTPVLKKVSFTIARGEMVAIRGPSGSGKSTLLYLISGLLSGYEGSVEVNGQNLKALDEEHLALMRNETIGFVFQQFHLLSRASVLENVLLPSRFPAEAPPRPDQTTRALDLIARLDLSERVDHQPNQLSGGQQQRVALARALLNDASILLADEPTGSLDSANSARIMTLLKEANQAGRTVIIITHDADVAKHCDRTIQLRDGEVVDDGQASSVSVASPPSRAIPSPRFARGRTWRVAARLLPVALLNLRRNRTRSALTMLGIVIGVAAVFATITLGAFTKRKILDSYAELGVNTVLFYGYPNWNVRAADKFKNTFHYFDYAGEITPLTRIFPQILMTSPIMESWGNSASFAGQTIDGEVVAYGVSSEGLGIIQRRVALGVGLSPYHVQHRSSVCVVGYDVVKRLFRGNSPLGQVIHLTQRDTSLACRVVGVLESQSSNREGLKPNLNIYLPYTFFQSTTDPWNARVRQILLSARPGVDVQRLGEALKAFFTLKYGRSAFFDVDSDSVLIAQMNKFLNLFTILLAGIALVSLSVGGIGITNMMLVSVTERYREIGIAKAFGATNLSVRIQFLLEALVLCVIAGVAGLALGFALYQGAIYGATKLVPKLAFEWAFDPVAFGLSLASILVVGIGSGLTPAVRAEKLEVIDALRSE